MATIVAKSAISVSVYPHENLEITYVPSDDTYGPHWVFQNEGFQFRLLLTRSEEEGVHHTLDMELPRPPV